MSTLRVNNITDTSGGSTNLTVPNTAKAWVNFNGTSTVAIRANYNVSSITDNGTGDYTVNFTTAMVDANYSAICSGKGSSDNRYTGLRNVPTTSSCSVYGHYHADSSFEDMEVMCVAVFR